MKLQQEGLKHIKMLQLQKRCFASRSTRRVSMILKSDLEHVGASGDIVSVKPGFARNFLYPKQMAVYATEKNRSALLKTQEENSEIMRLESEDLISHTSERKAMKLSHKVKSILLRQKVLFSRDVKFVESTYSERIDAESDGNIDTFASTSVITNQMRRQGPMEHASRQDLELPVTKSEIIEALENKLGLEIGEGRIFMDGPLLHTGTFKIPIFLESISSDKEDVMLDAVRERYGEEVGDKEIISEDAETDLKTIDIEMIEEKVEKSEFNYKTNVNLKVQVMANKANDEEEEDF